MNDIKGIIEDVEKSSLVSNKVIKKVIEIIGQEKWQDINDEEDDICTTAGELSITLRGIEDLEKENAELENKLNIANTNGENFIRQIADLAKENAELKKQLEMSNKVYNDNLDYSHHIEGQLTKAKRYIKELLKAVESSYSVLSWQRPPIKAEAEQFLSEVEK